MRRITTTALAFAAAMTLASVAFATPVPNSAVIHTRVFDDCPISILTVNNLFPATISIDDQNLAPQPLCAPTTGHWPLDALQRPRWAYLI